MTSAPGIVVVDASLALKWVLNEPDTPAALALLEEWQRAGVRAVAPSWFACEVGNILYRHAVGWTFTLAEAGELLAAALAQVQLQAEAPADAIRALGIAHAAGQKASYDAQYAALAERLGCELWTADGRFAAAVRGVLPSVRTLSEWVPGTTPSARLLPDDLYRRLSALPNWQEVLREQVEAMPEEQLAGIAQVISEGAVAHWRAQGLMDAPDLWERAQEYATRAGVWDRAAGRVATSWLREQFYKWMVTNPTIDEMARIAGEEVGRSVTYFEQLDEQSDAGSTA